MTTAQDIEVELSPAQVREFVGRQAETEAVMAGLAAESQAALRQFSLERMMGYSVDHADAVEVRARVVQGEAWRSAALAMAQTCLRFADIAAQSRIHPTRIAYLRRASALTRMSQVMMLVDTDERRDTYRAAAEQYRTAAALLGDREPVLVDAGDRQVAGWLFATRGPAVGSAIVVGGIEGWGLDFESLAETLAARGVETLLLDGPGQGETRLVHQGYLSADWRTAYRAAIDCLDARAPGRPIGIIGNSMGGSFAMAVAADDTRIRACCNNGGIIAPAMVPPVGTFFSKMVAFCGKDAGAQGQVAEAVDTWKTVTPIRSGANQGYPLLVVQGGKDPLVTTPMSEALLKGAPTQDKRMVVFSDGDHCIYNHKQDRDVLIADWMLERLSAA